MSLRGRQAGARSRVSMERYLVVTIGGMQVALSADAVEGLLTIAESGSDGNLAVQGHVYVPMDLASRLGLERDRDSPDTRVVLLAQGPVRASVRVAAVHGLVECERRQILPLPHQFRGAEREWYVGLLPLSVGMSVVLQTMWLLSGIKTAVSPGAVSYGHWQALMSQPVSPSMGGGPSC